MSWQWLEDRFGSRWEWLREGFLQLSLGAAWETQASHLPETLHSWIKNAVLAPFLKQEWLPSAREVAETVGKDFPDDPSGAVRAIQAVAGSFVRLWPKSSLKKDVLDRNDSNPKKRL